MTHLWTLIPHTIPFFSSPHNCPFNPPQTQQATAASCWIIATALSHRGRRVTPPELLSAPLSSVGAQPATLNGGRSRQAALRDGGAPDAATALLLRGIPGEAGTEGEGGFARCALLSAMLSPMHALWRAV